MRKRYTFKQGFEDSKNEHVRLTIKLSVITENMENNDVFRLLMALDREYRQLEKEKCGESERGFKQWRMVTE